MHENRETSRVPRSHWERGRSAKATSQTADRHGLEESDRAVLPVNQPNKEGQPPAEVGEGREGKGRAWTQENIVPSHTSPTQSGERVSQGLYGVRQVAKRSTLRRQSSKVRAVCVEALIRICTGGISDGRPYRDSCFLEPRTAICPAALSNKLASNNQASPIAALSNWGSISVSACRLCATVIGAEFSVPFIRFFEMWAS